MISRRGLLSGIFASAMAPAVVKANSLMKLKSGILVPSQTGIIVDDYVPSGMKYTISLINNVNGESITVYNSHIPMTKMDMDIANVRAKILNNSAFGANPIVPEGSFRVVRSISWSDVVRL